MPSSMPTLDDQFPTLKGDESPRDMFLAIVNYLFVMKESLDYTLANLSSDNWNSAAWNEMTEGAKEPLIIMEKQLEYVAGIVSKVNNELLTQKITVGDLTEDMGKTKDRVTALEDRADTVAGDVDYLLEQVVAQETSINDLTENMGKTEDRVTVLENRADTAEGDITDLKGRADTVEGDITDLKGRADTAEGDITDLKERTNTQGGLLDELAERLGKLESRITVDENGATTIGKESTPLNLVGEVSINGTPYEEEEI